MGRIGFEVAHWVAFALLGGAVLCASARDELDYRRRGDHYEGIKQKPVSGYDIELLSASVGSKDNSESLGERFHIRFFLEQPVNVHIVVRELDNRHFYWLDKVQPKEPWKAGFDNVFDWPTGDVVQPLRDLRMADLGVVARLERDSPSATEKIAPAVFYQTQLPTRVTDYVFRFMLREDAKVTGKVYKRTGGEPIASVDLGRQLGGRVFSFKWNATSPPAPEGGYKLVISGYMLSNNDPVSQVVEFYHRPLIN